MEWSAATAEATQALGLVIEVTKGHEHGVRKHEQGVRKHVRLGRTLVHGQHQPSIQVYIIQLYKYSRTQCIMSAYLCIIMQLCKLY